MMEVLRNLAYRVRLITSRGVVRRVDDTAEVQRAQVDLGHGEVADKVEVFQQYGFTSVSPTPAEAIVLAIGAARSHLVALLPGQRAVRKKGLKSGEVAMHTAEGDYILMKNGRVIEVVAGAALNVSAPSVTVTATTKVTFDTPLVEATQDMQIGGNLEVGGDVHSPGTITGDTDVVAAGISGKSHDHSAGTEGDGTTGEPNP